MNRQISAAKREARESELLFSNFIKEELEHEGFTEEYMLPDVVSHSDAFLASASLAQSYNPIEQAPVQQSYAPVQQGYVPVQQGYVPVQQGYVPVQKDYVPVQKDYVPGQVILERGYTPVSTAVSTPEGYSSPELTIYGKIIRELADEFSKSVERRKVLEAASEVDIERIDKDSFLKLLEKVFSKGVSRKRFVALFFFCSDLLIRAARKKLKEIYANLFLWSLEYISDNVSLWVQEHGGWGKVLQNIWETSAFKIVLTSVFVVGIAFGLYYIMYN